MLFSSLLVKRLLVLILVTSSLVMFYVGRSSATDHIATCSNEGCSGITGPLFNERNMVPKIVISRYVTVKNKYKENRKTVVQVNQMHFDDSNPKLSKVLTIEIIPEGSSNPIYGPVSIEQWKRDGQIMLTSVSAGKSQKYQFRVKMDDVGNSYQGKKLRFDLSIGFNTVPDSHHDKDEHHENDNRFHFPDWFHSDKR